jgi:hypothetical protein
VHVEFLGIELLRAVEVGKRGIEITAADMAAAALRKAAGVALIEAKHLTIVGDTALTIPGE